MHQFSDKTGNLEFLGPDLPKNGFWDQSLKNITLDLESASSRYYVYQFSDKTDNFEFLDPNLLNNEFLGRNFKNLSVDSESGSLRYYVYQFSTTLNFWAQICPKTDFRVGVSKI